MGLPSTGQPIEFDVTLMFPWDREQKLFKGERIYFAIDRNLILNVGQLLRRMARNPEARSLERPTATAHKKKTPRLRGVFCLRINFRKLSERP